MRTLALVNQKGGVGKSFVSVQLSFHLAEQGRRVLLVDLDHQGNSSAPLIKSGRATLAAFSAADVLAGDALVLPDASFVVLRGDQVLSTLERQPAHRKIGRVIAAAQITRTTRLNILTTMPML